MTDIFTNKKIIYKDQSALKRVLETLSHRELLELVSKLSDENNEVQLSLLRTLAIPLKIISSQPANPKQIEELKARVNGFIEYAQENAHDWEFYEEEEYPELNEILLEAKVLHPGDQLEVYSYLLAKIDTIFHFCPIGTQNLQNTVVQYAKVVSQLNLSSENKQPHFDYLLNCLHLEMADYGEFSETIKKALDTLATSQKDYHYLIQKLQNENPKENDWIIDCYLKLGDDKKYLELRLKHLSKESDYLELAIFWKNKGNEEKYVTTLESWVKKLTKDQNEKNIWDSQISNFPKKVLEELFSWYKLQKDAENMYRIALATAEFDSTTLDLYKKIIEIASKLGKQKEAKEKFILFASPNTQTLAEVYLYEKQYQDAISLAKKEIAQELLVEFVANNVKQTHPKEAVELYKKLVQQNIDRKSREDYQEAAQYAKKMKSVHLESLKDPVKWQTYISAVRLQYHKFPALLDEFSHL